MERENVETNEFPAAPAFGSPSEGVGSSFLLILNSWLLNCTAHGIPRAVGSNNYLRRMFWFAASLTSIVLLLYQTSVMMQDVFKYPVTVSFQLKYRTEIQMPVVTVCNSNKLKYSSLSKYFNADTDLQYAAKFQRFSDVGLSVIYEELTDLQYNGSILDESDPGQGCNNTFVVDWSSDESIIQRMTQVKLACEDGETCYRQTAQCENRGECTDGSDVSEARCGVCPSNFYECLNKECIRPELRCDGEMDCTDGSDEFPKYCDPELTKEYFVCCTSNTIIPLSKACDEYDDCPRDKSDQYLRACQNKIGALKCLAARKSPGTDYSVITLREGQLHNGISDCEYEVDETCSWKENQQDWSNPFATEDYNLYESFLTMLDTEPSATRWFYMASPEEIRLMGHKYKDMILICVNNNRLCNETIRVFDSVSQDYGMCYSFQQKSNVNSSGPTYGLQVLFNLESYDSLGLFTPNGGIKMFLTAPGKVDRFGDVMVDWTSEINLSPGFDHAIKLTPQEITKKGYPYSSCEEYGREMDLEGFSTRADCQRFCLLQKMYDDCGCTDDIWFREAPLCNLSNSSGIVCVDNLKASIDISTVCDCPNACDTKTYNVMTSKLDWPTKTSFPRFLATILHAARNDERLRTFVLDVIEEFNNQKGSVESESLTAIRASFGQFTVYFPDRSIEVVTERPVYTFVGILSSLGGLLGLYLGFSALTLLEVVDFVIDLLQHQKLKKRRNLVAVASPTEKACSLETESTGMQSKEAAAEMVAW